MKRWLMVMLIIWGNLGISFAQQITVVTEDFPPFQSKEGNEVKGMATEVVKAALKEAGISAEIEMYPWARAYQMASSDPNVLIYSIARTKEREAHFKWVGTVTPYRVYLWKLKERDEVQVNTLEEAKKYRTGGVNKDVKQDYLVSKGFEVGTHIDVVHEDKLNIQKLFAKRIDLMPFDEISFAYKVKEQKQDFAKLEKTLLLEEISSDLYMAFSISTAEDLVRKVQEGLEKVKSSGVYDQIKAKYLGP